MTLSIAFFTIAAFSTVIINCSPVKPDSVTDYEGEFRLLSLNPPSEEKLRMCDTIMAVFAYTLPARISTADSVYRFWMSISVPTRMIGACHAESKKRHDTLMIACPVHDFIAPLTYNQSVEIKFTMITTRECYGTASGSGSCGDVIEYSLKYKYNAGIDTMECH